MTPRVYVASPFQDAPRVRDLHERLRAFGFTPTSTWAESARGPENLSQLDDEQARAIATANDRDLGASDIVLVLAREGAGREMYSEMALARILRKPIFFVGPVMLSARRPGVTICEGVDDAIARMLAWARGAA